MPVLLVTNVHPNVLKASGPYGAILSKGEVTIWPVYAYTSAAQNTVIKLLMVILYDVDNTSMSWEDIHAKLFAHFVHYLVEI